MWKYFPILKETKPTCPELRLFETVDNSKLMVRCSIGLLRLPLSRLGNIQASLILLSPLQLNSQLVLVIAFCSAHV